MAKLKNKILHFLNGKSKIDTTLNELSNFQENLLKNYTNPVFNKKDKSKLLKSYTNLHEIGKSLYRFNTLQENNYLNDAQEEKENIENVVLKGGVSYYKYVWHSENGEHTCDECKALDGKEFDFYDEVPECPHPNCRCWVEVVENNDENPNPQDENKIPSQIPTPQPTPKPTPAPIPQSQKWIMPCEGRITAPYQEVREGYIHNGIDIGVPVGTPIKAIADGQVYYASSNDPYGYGIYIIIDHGMINGKFVTSEYGHLSKWIVNIGQKINQGQVIGYSGNTGHSTGPHLHLTIREGKYKGHAVNPYEYIQND